jgi:hypothetical protein
MQFPIIDFVAGPAAARTLACLLALCLVGAALSPASADSAYINQTTARSSGAGSGQTNAQPVTIAVPQYGPRSTAFMPTPETASPSHINGNIAQTLQIGSSNQVLQAQAGQNNLSNVGVIGGAGNNVGVLQGGHDLSNLFLVNTSGLSIGVIQPNGAAPLNLLIARLPDGRLMIKR